MWRIRRRNFIDTKHCRRFPRPQLICGQERPQPTNSMTLRLSFPKRVGSGRRHLGVLLFCSRHSPIQLECAELHAKV